MSSFAFFIAGIVMALVAMGLAQWIGDCRALMRARRIQLIRQVAETEMQALADTTTNIMGHEIDGQDDWLNLERLRQRQTRTMQAASSTSPNLPVPTDRHESHRS